MRILIDTNILISAALNRNGTPYHAFRKAVSRPNRGLVCRQNIDELRRIFQKKFPGKMQALETFWSAACFAIEIIPTPVTPLQTELKVRDPNDRPILRAALYAGADILLTGDKDFLEANLTYPKVMTASEFLII